MWFAKMALRHMHTFVVAALMIAVLGAVSAYRMSTDVFPSVNIPIASVVWQHTGMPAEQTVARLRRVDRRHLRRAGGVHWHHGSERVAASETLGRVTQRAKSRNWARL